MPKKRYKSEEIVAKLRQVDVHLSQGSSVADAIRQIGVSRSHLLSLAPGVRRPEDQSGQTPQGTRNLKTPACVAPYPT